MPALIRLDFDPSVSIAGLAIRLETVALAAIVLGVLLLVAVAAGRQADDESPHRPGRHALRRDDMLLIALGAVPGAIVGGRLGYGLVHLDYYSGNLAALADPAGAGMELSLAVVLGTLSGLAVAGLLSSPAARWLGLARLPVLLGLGLGKLAMVLGGTGQGSFSDASWATVYVRGGPWGSLNAGEPAVPSQAVEGFGLLAAAVVFVLLPVVLRFRVLLSRDAIEFAMAPRRTWALLDGWRGYVAMLLVWSAVRFAAAVTWRDSHVMGPLNAEQLVLLGLVVCLTGALLLPEVVAALRRFSAERG